MTSQRITGLLLMAIGAALLLVLTTDVGPEVIVGFLGLGFLVAYAATRIYGLLIPGGILTGLGTGLVIESQGGPGGSVVLGLGCGFLAIAVIDRLVSASSGVWWWPLVPGAILVTAGASTLTGVPDLQRYFVPAALIVIGAGLVLRRPSGRRAGRDGVASSSDEDGRGA